MTGALTRDILLLGIAGDSSGAQIQFQNPDFDNLLSQLGNFKLVGFLIWSLLKRLNFSVLGDWRTETAVAQASWQRAVARNLSAKDAAAGRATMANLRSATASRVQEISITFRRNFFWF